LPLPAGEGAKRIACGFALPDEDGVTSMRTGWEGVMDGGGNVAPGASGT
jgi:hypothetical protein